MYKQMGSFEDAIIERLDKAKGDKPHFKTVVRYLAQQVRNGENANNRRNDKGISKEGNDAR